MAGLTFIDSVLAGQKKESDSLSCEQTREAFGMTHREWQYYISTGKMPFILNIIINGRKLKQAMG